MKLCRWKDKIIARDELSTVYQLFLVPVAQVAAVRKSVEPAKGYVREAAARIVSQMVAPIHGAVFT